MSYFRMISRLHWFNIRISRNIWTIRVSIGV